MKTLNLYQMQNITANGDGQDLVSGILCGIALGAAIPTGGWSLVGVVASCAVLFGNW
jgi:hypothetical protein